MTDPYEQDRKDLADAIALFMINTGVSSFVLPDFLCGQALAFGEPEFIKEHLPDDSGGLTSMDASKAEFASRMRGE